MSGQEAERRHSSADGCETGYTSLIFSPPDRTATLLALLTSTSVQFPQACLHLSGRFSGYKSVELAQAVTAVTLAGNPDITLSPPLAFLPQGHMQASDCSPDSDKPVYLGCFPLLSMSGLV